METDSQAQKNILMFLKKLSNFFQKHQDVLYKNSRSFFKTETELPALYDD